MPLKCPFIVGFVQENDLYRVRLTEVSAECRFIYSQCWENSGTSAGVHLIEGVRLIRGPRLIQVALLPGPEGKHVYIIDH